MGAKKRNSFQSAGVVVQGLCFPCFPCCCACFTSRRSPKSKRHVKELLGEQPSHSIYKHRPLSDTTRSTISSNRQYRSSSDPGEMREKSRKRVIIVNNPSRSRHNGNPQIHPPRNWYSALEMSRRSNCCYTNYGNSFYPERQYPQHSLRREKLSRIDSIKKSLGRMCIAWRLCVLPPDSDTESYHKYPYPLHSYSDTIGRERHCHSHYHCCHSEGSRRASGSVRGSREHREEDSNTEQEDSDGKGAKEEEEEDESDKEEKRNKEAAIQTKIPNNTRPLQNQKAKKDISSVETINENKKVDTTKKSKHIINKPHSHKKPNIGGGEGPSDTDIVVLFNKSRDVSSLRKMSTKSKHTMKSRKKRKKKKWFLRWLFKRKKKKKRKEPSVAPLPIRSFTSYNTGVYHNSSKIKTKHYKN